MSMASFGAMMRQKQSEHKQRKVNKMSNNEVGNKYKIFDAKTGEEKKGKYFCLRIDANDEQERDIVEAAMLTYIRMHKAANNHEYAENVLGFFHACRKGGVA